MRSLSLRIGLTSLAIILASLAAFLALFIWMTAPQVDRMFRSLQSHQFEEVLLTLEREGPQAATGHLARMDRSLDARHYVTDAAGRDLVTGADRSALLNAPHPWFGPPRLPDGRVVLVQPSEDGRHRLIAVAAPMFDIWDFAPYYALIIAAVAVMSWMLATGIVAPIRDVAAAVGRFGRGDLRTRVSSARRDEIGQLGHSFNDMADRIEALLTAERRLLQDISHELRSPLARLQIAIELARTAPDRDAAAERLQKEVGRLTSLVGALIEGTRAEGDPDTRRRLSVDLARVLQDVVARCALEASARDCRVVVDASAMTAGVVGDPDLLDRAIENLLRNAIRYAPIGSTIDCETRRAGDDVVVTIRDRGPGVPDHVLSQMARPFFRVEEARDYSPAGSVGLGLWIAKRAVEVHRGRLVVENAGPGLRVALVIPAAPRPDRA